MKTITSACLLLLLLSPLAQLRAQDSQEPVQSNGLALTPPMGWNSWNKFDCNVSEDLIKQMADAMVKSGMKAAGYQYIVIDDCWQVSRDKEGNIVPDPQHFPSGMKALADYVHSRGLKFGLYSDAGTKTCQGRPGSRGYEFQDARQYAAWGVDYLKYDWCNTGTQDGHASYLLMHNALLQSGRPIVFSMCEWGTAKPWLWAKDIGNLWRTTGDIYDAFSRREHGLGMVEILDLQAGLESFAGPGHWNDPDMLEVGNGGMTDTEYRSHFSLWAILAAPLMAGNDLRDMGAATREILTNQEVIAIDQDALGKQGSRVWKNGDLEVWARPLKDGGRAVVLFNRGASQQTVSIGWEDLGYPAYLSAAVRDLWQHKDLGKFTGKYSAAVASHGVVMVTVKP
ncbi:MAG: alpha-galactosidase [Acidobacteria bacterium]|nr:alpha-galactosidase [Acidobacteriota bacterium]